MSTTRSQRLISRKLILISSGVAAAALLLSAFSVTSMEKASGAQDKKLTFWIHAADPFIAAHKSIIKKFEAANPGVTIDLQSFPFAEFNTRVVASIPRGKGPDVLEAYSPWMTGYIRAGRMAAVPSSVGTVAQLDKRYYPSTLPTLLYQKNYYGIPSNLAAGSTRVLLVNDKVIQDSGVKLPVNGTFADWISTWQALTVKDNSGSITRSGLGQSCGQPADQFVTYLLQYGGTLLSKDGKKSAFNSKAGEQALQLLGDLVNKYKVDSPSLTEFNCIPQALAASGHRGTWVYPVYQGSVPSFTGTYVSLPLPTGASKNLWQGGSGWATFVPKASKKSSLAWKFVKFQQANWKGWHEQTGEIPADRALAKSMAAKNPKLYGAYLPVLSQSVNGYPFGDYFVNYQTLSDMVTSVVLEKASVQDALKTAESAVNAGLAQWWRQYP